MKQIFTKAQSFACMAIFFVMMSISCTKVEPEFFKPTMEQTIDANTKAQSNPEKLAAIEIFLYNDYEENIDVTLKNVTLCEVKSDNSISRTTLFYGSMELKQTAELIKSIDMPEGAVNDNLYIEFTYDAVSKNGCTLAENYTAKADFFKDANNNFIRTWKGNNTYHYAFTPKFQEITFNPTVADWQ